ncbi:MAG: hypothetical protein ACP5LP_03670 [Candidatus Micrarchaeia archaeon]
MVSTEVSTKIVKEQESKIVVIADEGKIIPYSSFVIVAKDGNIKEVRLGEPLVPLTRKEYNGYFANNPEFYKEFNEKILDRLKNSKEEQELRWSNLIRLGGGLMTIYEVGGQYFLAMPFRDKDAPGIKLVLDIGAGIGDISKFMYTVMREGVEETLAYNGLREVIAGIRSNSLIIPQFSSSNLSLGKYNKFIEEIIYATAKKVGIEFDALIYKEAKLVTPSNPTIFVENDGEKHSLYSAIEYLNQQTGPSIEAFTGIITKLDDIKNLEDLGIQDGEFAGETYLHRQTVIVNIESGSTFIYKDGKMIWKGNLEEFVKVTNAEQEKIGINDGRIATIKVAKFVDNTDLPFKKEVSELLRKGY